MRLSKRLKRGAVYFLARGAFAVLNVIPRSAAMFIGSWFGLTAWAVLPRERHRAVRHLTLIFGDTLTPRERHLISRRYFINTGKNLAEFVRFKKHFESEIKPLVSCEGLEHFDAAYKAGKGIVGITGHIGNFELLAVYIAGLGYKVAVIGREMYDRRLDKLLVDNRSINGVTNFSTEVSPREILSWLKAGNVLGVLIDTDSIRVRSMFIPAFGRLSNTPIGQTILGLRTGAAFVPIACVRTVDNRYRVIVKPPVTLPEQTDSETAIYEVTRKCTNELEAIITAHKDQWPWFTNRWRTRPENRP